MRQRWPLFVPCVLLVFTVFFNGHYSLREWLFDRLLVLEHSIFGAKLAPVEVWVVAIGDRSVNTSQGWPWPRSRYADLLDALDQQKPAAVALDIVFVKRSTYGPEDEILLFSLHNTPALTLAHFMTTDDYATNLSREDMEPLAFRDFDDARLTSSRIVETDEWLLPSAGEIDSLARQHGFVNDDWTDDLVVRRGPLFVRHDNLVATSFAAATTLAYLKRQDQSVHVEEDATGFRISGEISVHAPLDAEGMSRPRFRPPNEERRIEASVLINPSNGLPDLEGDIVLVGVDALGVRDVGQTAFGQSSGVEIHAQTIESLLAGTMLGRPVGLQHWELVAAIIVGILLIAYLPRISLYQASLVTMGITIATSCVALVALRSHDILIDSLPSIGMALTLFLGKTWSHFDEVKQRRQEADQRLRQLEAEMRAARAIQLAILPATDQVAGLPPSVSLDAAFVQARFVGGDFYDTIMVKDGRLFFIVADVSGKGPEGAFFMAIAKAFIQSVALGSDGDPGMVLRVAEREIMRNNPKQLFVTAVAGLLDPRSGDLTLCNAGHPPPLYVSRDGRASILETRPCPPVGMVPSTEFVTSSHHLKAGDQLLAFTDGLSELLDQGQGHSMVDFQKFIEHIMHQRTSTLSAESIVHQALQSSDTDQQDDIAILVIGRSTETVPAMEAAAS